MSLKDESQDAFRDLWGVIPGEVMFNRLVRPCITHTLQESKTMEVAGSNYLAISQLEMLESHFLEFENIAERTSLLNTREASGDFDDDRSATGEWGPDFVFIKKDNHTNSATVSLYLVARNAIDA